MLAKVFNIAFRQRLDGTPPHKFLVQMMCRYAGMLGLAITKSQFVFEIGAKRNGSRTGLS